MSNSASLRLLFPAMLLLASSFSFAQTNTGKIKGKWSVNKFDAEKNNPQAIKAQQELQGVCLIFGNEELVISKKTESGDSILKRGPYTVTGNTISIGKDQADILLLNEQHLTINIPKQGVMYFTKM